MSNNSNPTFVKSMNLFGNHIKQIPCIVGEGSPTSDTYGAVGMLYMDSSNNGEMWKCIEVSDTIYTWVKLVSEDSGENVNLTVETITVGETGSVPVTGITLDYSTISLTAGESMMLAASVAPSDATNNTVLWESSNTSIATVNNGYVTAVAEGDAVITAYSAEDSSIKATCSVTVAAESGGDEPGGETGETVKVYFTEHDVVSGKLYKKDGSIVAISGACYVEIPYHDGMYIITNHSSGWLTNYPPFIVYDNDTNIVAEYTEYSTSVYQTTLTGYSATAKVYINIKGYLVDGKLDGNGQGNSSLQEKCYYTYET